MGTSILAYQTYTKPTVQGDTTAGSECGGGSGSGECCIVTYGLIDIIRYAGGTRAQTLHPFRSSIRRYFFKAHQLKL
jgi:hypothetical protein